jgi:hypothetical protein
MSTITVLALAILAVAAVGYAVRLVVMIKRDGYGFRSSSGLPRDWAPTETQSWPYSLKPHF